MNSSKVQLPKLNIIPLENYKKAINLANNKGTLRIELSISTDRCGGETVDTLREFVALAEKISNLLNLNLKDFPLSHCWKYSDHEVALKYIDFEDSEIEVGKLALYNNSEKVIIHEILKDSVVSYVLFDSPDKILHTTYNSLRSLNFIVV